MPNEAQVAAVVLAAGRSSRMGSANKLLLPLGSESLVRRAVHAAREAGLSPVLVVLGHDAERVQQELIGLACEPVVNPHYALGIKSSLRQGMSHVPPACDAAVVLLADMPFVTVAMLVALVDAYRSTLAPLVASRYGAVHAPPMLYARALFGEFAPGAPARCGKALLAHYQDQAAFVDQPEQALADVDVAADYQRAREFLLALASAKTLS